MGRSISNTWLVHCRLYSWEAAHTYYAPYELSSEYTGTDLGCRSQQLQLQQMVAGIQMQHGVEPLLLCHSHNSPVTAAVGFKHFGTGLQESAAGSQTQPIVWLSNDAWLAQSPTELSTTLGYLTRVHCNSAHMQSHGNHYLIMQYSSANAPLTVEEVQAEFSRMSSSSFRVKRVQTTVQPNADNTHDWPPCNAVAANSALPYMLVEFEVGTPPAEPVDGSSTESDQIDLTGDSPAASPTGQRERSPKHTPTKRPAEHTAGPAATKKRVSSSAETAAARMSPQNASSAAAAAALGHQESMPGHYSYNQHISCFVYMHHFAWQRKCS